MPHYLPIALSLKERSCLVVGGGKVAARRVKSLLEANAQITVVAPYVTEELEAMRKSSLIRLEHREYQPEDISTAQLVFAATDRTEVNDRVTADARRAGKLVCDADSPELGDFILPATVMRGPLMISITTGGSSPALVSRIREDMLKLFGPEYVPFVQMLGEARKQVLASSLSPAERSQLLVRLAADEKTLELIRDDKVDEARERMQACISSLSG